MVIRSELDPNFAYLQIIAVELYLTPDELLNRETLFEQNFNINRFIFETPFTKSGKAHGDMAEQYKRKTILTVETSFPYLRKTAEIISKEEIVMTPIETAFEQIERKTVSTKAELSLADPNIKTLQMCLQGSLLLQVNVGPLEICRVFLGDNMTKYEKKHVEILSIAMNQFVKVLGQALEVNQSIIKSDQLVLQRELDSSLNYLKSEISKYMILDLDQNEEKEREEEIDKEDED